MSYLIGVSRFYCSGRGKNCGSQETYSASGTLAVLKVEGLSIIRHFFALRNKNQELPVAEILWNYLIAKADADMKLPGKG